VNGQADRFRDLQASEYLIELYSEANELWNQFHASQNPIDLGQTARLLCDGLGGLQEDSAFWSAAYSLTQSLEHERIVRQGEVDAVFFNIERLLVLEEDLLTVRFGRARARALVTDLANALEIVRRFPDPMSVQNLQNRMSSLRSSVCDASELSTFYRPSRRPWRERFYRCIRVVGRGLRFARGGALVVANGYAFFDPSVGMGPLEALSSVSVGLRSMFQQMEAHEQEGEQNSL
jgi:hypothetical protein